MTDRPDVPEWLLSILVGDGCRTAGVEPTRPSCWTAGQYVVMSQCCPACQRAMVQARHVASAPAFQALVEKAEALDWLGTSQGFAGHPDIEWLAPADEENLPNGGWAVYFDHPSKTAYGGTPVEAIQRARQEPTDD